jgi:queuine tRNA-ribosyltransferase subunit QTRTD1
MKFIVESVSKCSGRLGLLSNIERLADRTYNTPFLLFNSPNLSREVLELSGFNLSNDFGILLPVTNVEQMESPLKSFKNGIAEFVGLKECLTMITLKNPIEFSVTGHHEKGNNSF